MSSVYINNNSTVLASTVDTYADGWIGFEILLSISFVLNLTTFCLCQFHPTIKNTFDARLLKFLCAQGFLWSALCLAQCAVNLDERDYVYQEGIPCQFQSMYMQFFILMNGFSLCIGAYSVERRVYLSQKGIPVSQIKFSSQFHYWVQSPKSLFFTHITCWLISFIVVIVSHFAISPAILEPSQTFCFLSLNNRFNSILLFLPLLSFGIFLTHRYKRIFRFVVQQNRNRLGVHSKNSQHQQQQQISLSIRDDYSPKSNNNNNNNESQCKENLQQEQKHNPSPPLLAVPKPANKNKIAPLSLALELLSPRKATTPIITTTTHPRETMQMDTTPRNILNGFIFEKRLARRMILFVLCYTFCCIPAAIVAMSQLISPSFWLSSNPVFFLFAAHSMHANAIFNALVLFWMNRSMRKAVRKAICKKRVRWMNIPVKQKKAGIKPTIQNYAVLQYICCGLSCYFPWIGDYFSSHINDNMIIDINESTNDNNNVNNDNNKTTDSGNGNTSRNQQWAAKTQIFKRPRAASMIMLPSRNDSSNDNNKNNIKNHPHYIGNNNKNNFIYQPKTALADMVLPPSRYGEVSRWTFVTNKRTREQDLIIHHHTSNNNQNIYSHRLSM